MQLPYGVDNPEAPPERTPKRINAFCGDDNALRFVEIISPAQDDSTSPEEQDQPTTDQSPQKCAGLSMNPRSGAVPDIAVNKLFQKSAKWDLRCQTAPPCSFTTFFLAQRRDCKFPNPKPSQRPIRPRLKQQKLDSFLADTWNRRADIAYF